jgi:hypothetical protein
MWMISEGEYCWRLSWRWVGWRWVAYGFDELLLRMRCRKRVPVGYRLLLERYNHCYEMPAYDFGHAKFAFRRT